MKKTIFAALVAVFCLAMVSCGESKTGMLKNHEWVDLGLPSGTKWASMNLGAEEASDWGDYLAWGESAGVLYGKKDFGWETYAYGKEDLLEKYNEADMQTVLSADDDIATRVWGKGWTVPTKEQIDELRTCCTWTWEGKGYEVKGISGATIFLPAAGYYRGTLLKSKKEEGGYWSSTRSANNVKMALGLYLDEQSVSTEECERCLGQSIRPVCKVTSEN